MTAHGNTNDGMVPDPKTPIASTLSQRSSSLARRILDGAGMATMVAHAMISADGNLDAWTCDLPTHGATASGRFVVALRPSQPRHSARFPPAYRPTFAWRFPRIPQNRESDCWRRPSTFSEP